eukprot:m.14264 g.14264  ORF g.14264 m.14264 type:complete len:2573 (+) comp5051_c0_seq1:157-7875(+)
MSAAAKKVAQDVIGQRLSSHTKVRIKALSAASDFVSQLCTEDEPKAFYEAVLKAVTPTLKLYSDRPSRLAALQLVEALVENHTEIALPCLVSCLSGIQSSSWPARTALGALYWACLAYNHASSPSMDDQKWLALNSFVGRLLLALSEPKTNIRVLKSAEDKLKQVIKSNPEIAKRIVGLSTNSKADKEILIVCSWIVSESAHVKPAPELGDLTSLFDLCVTHVIPSTKNPTDPTILVGAAGCFRVMTKEIFTEKILPAIQRSFKRNSSSAIASTPSILEQITIDLSQCSDALLTCTVEMVRNADANIRLNAVKFIKTLTKKCSHSEHVLKIEARLATTLNKCSLPDYKMAALECIAGLSKAPVPKAGKTDLCTAVTKSLSSFCGKETADNILIAAIKTMTEVAKQTDNIPNEFQEALQSFLKKGSPTFHAHCFYAALQVFKDDKIKNGYALGDDAFKILEKCSTKNQQGVQEASAAACFALRVATDSSSHAAKVNKGLSVFKMEDPKWKDLMELPDAVLPHLELTCYVLGDTWFKSLTSSKTIKSWIGGFILALAQSNHDLRRAACDYANKCVSESLGSAVYDLILTELFDFVKQNAASENNVPSPILRDVFVDVASHPSKTANLKDLSLQLLIPSHDEQLVKGGKLIWPTLVKSYGLNINKLLEDEADKVVSCLLESIEDDSCAVQNTIASVVSSESVRVQLTGEILSILSNDALRRITEYEIGVYNTEASMLYDEAKKAKNTIDDEIAALDPNSKDYEEKKWELMVKKELEAKKAASQQIPKGKSKKQGDAKLNKHEAERRAAQLKKEQEIRSKVQALRKQVDKVQVILTGLITHGPSYLAEYMAAIVTALTKQVSSLLAGRDFSSLVLNLSRVLNDKFASKRELISYSLLRIGGAYDTIPPTWRKKNLNDMVASAVREMWSVVHEADPVDLGTFCYCWPIITHVLYGKESSISACEDALVFLSSHAQLGGVTHAPRLEILQLLLFILDNRERLAHQTAVFIADFCKSAQNTDENFANTLCNGFDSSLPATRRAVLDALANLPLTESNFVSASLWRECFDVDESIKDQALKLWEQSQLTPPANVELLYDTLMSRNEPVRKSSALAIADIVQKQDLDTVEIVDKLVTAHTDSLIVPEPVRDHLGNIISPEHDDPWYVRAGVAEALHAMAEQIPDSKLLDLFQFVLESGLADHDHRSAEGLLAASQKLVECKGKENVSVLLPVFENFLETAEQRQIPDIVRQSAVVLLGSLARHLDKSDPKVPEILETLIITLSTPSEAVQEAVANCIIPLIASVKPKAPEIINRLFNDLLEHEAFGVRRGAAHGLSGVIKGFGISALKQEGVSERLQKALEDKKNARHREGALMAYELICIRLGRIFEPYIVNILPQLLICFGDGNQNVREAAQETSDAIMSKLSSHGVKLVLPHLLKALEDNQWRTKQGSVMMLGGMAFCAPKQLSACLPQVVPCLSEVLHDSHQKVQKAGNDALQKIGSVIRNPEIQVIVQILLNAINEPDVHTNKALEKLMETAFVHVIDAASLALIMPILDRALNNRAASGTKKMAAQIIGNMYSLTDIKDLSPYLPKVLPGVKESLLDPDPSVRGIAAKALGSMMAGMGEQAFPDLLPWLLEKLQTGQNSVDRSGAAQGASEVIHALGSSKLEALLPTFIERTKAKELLVREGNLLLFVYLPVTFHDKFLPFVESVIPCIIRGIADVEESVRDVAMRAGTGIINFFSETSIELLLPELEAGLFDEQYRIRESSVKLLGELLYKVSGLSGKKTTVGGGDDDNFGTEESEETIIEVLGKERRDRVLSGLYMARQDSAVFVRQAAAHVWKIVVHHSIRTLRDILPALMDVMLKCLESDDPERRYMAAKTLAEIVSKLGERVLPLIFPILQKRMQSEKGVERQGVAVGLSEIMVVTTHEQIIEFEDFVIPLVRDGLCDAEETVRAKTADAFARLHTCIGNDAVNSILPYLLQSMDNPDMKAYALDGLKQIMSAKSKVVLPFLVPRLIELPLSMDNARALGSLASVAGSTLNSYLSSILSCFMEASQTQTDENLDEIVKNSCRSIVLSADAEGLSEAVSFLCNIASTGQEKARALVMELLADISRDATEDLEDVIDDIIEGLLLAFMDESTTVRTQAWGGLDAIMKQITDDKAGKIEHISGVLFTLEVNSNGTEIAGFSVPNGIQPIFTLVHDSLIHGTREAQQWASTVVGQLVKLTPAEMLEPFIKKFTGGLIKIIGSSSGGVKAAMFSAICTILEKESVPQMLKAMLPQLTPTSLKALNDPDTEVRSTAVKALHMLMPYQRRVDVIFKNVVTGIKTSEGRIQLTYLQACRSICEQGGDKANEASITSTIDALTEESILHHADDVYRNATAQALAALCKHLPDDTLAPILKNHAFTESGGDWIIGCAHSSLVEYLYLEASDKMVGHLDKATAKITEMLTSDNENILCSAAESSVAVILSHDKADSVGSLLKALLKLTTNIATSKDVIRSVIDGFEHLIKYKSSLEMPTLATGVNLLRAIIKVRSGSIVKDLETVLSKVLNEDNKASYISSLSEKDQLAFEEYYKQSLEGL